jgi:hypothetical protein
MNHRTDRLAESLDTARLAFGIEHAHQRRTARKLRAVLKGHVRDISITSHPISAELTWRGPRDGNGLVVIFRSELRTVVDLHLAGLDWSQAVQIAHAAVADLEQALTTDKAARLVLRLGDRLVPQATEILAAYTRTTAAASAVEAARDLARETNPLAAAVNRARTRISGDRR